MAQLNQYNPQGMKSQPENRRRWMSGPHLPAVCAGIVVLTVIIGLGSCSKKSDTPITATSSQSTEPQSTVSGPVSTTPAIVTPAPAPKKVRKARPTTATYINGTYGVSFTYPRKYSLLVGDKTNLGWAGMGPGQTDFVKQGGATIAALALPENLYPGTDFASAAFNLSVNSGLTASECAQFAFPDSESSKTDSSATVKIGATEFHEIENVTGGATKQAEAKYYHVFQNGACYEFALGVGTARDGAEDVIPQVDRTQVFRRLEGILATVRIRSMDAHGTDGPAQTQPAPEEKPAQTGTPVPSSASTPPL